MNAIIDLLLHPLLQLFRPLIATHPIERVADAINAAIDMGYRGLGVFGFARFGKTESITYLIDHPFWLAQRPAAMLRVDAPDTHKRTDSSFFRSLLTLLGVRVPLRANPDELCTQLMGRLIEVAQNSGTHLIILFLDEAQRLLPADYEHLVTLDNRMTRAGYYFFVVLFHQRDITGFSNEVLPSNDHPPHVTGRFLVRKHEFTGLVGVDEVAYALTRYDEGTEWPPGTGISYTQHFAPDAFANGFRLANYAQRLWDCASHLRAEARLPTEWTWPMKSFEATVVYLLTATIPCTPSFESFDDEQLIAALRAAGLVELEKSRHTYQPQGCR
ncbi:ATP-binding protein [Thermomonas sp.]|uniref:ATP-binding protein n=1 Tax=Thermomonas sp. TaxID=1971895 RepID=UPI00262331F7|nr:ATP-binding protein [Thermomonas sp.]